MSRAAWRSSPSGSLPSTDLGGFRCGQPDLDHWLVQAAVDADRAGTARTFVWHDADRVVAYLSLCPHEVRRDSLPEAWRSEGRNAIRPSCSPGSPSINGSTAKASASSFSSTLERAAAAAAAAGGRVIVVDAIDDRAARFYERYGFRPCPDLRSGSSARLPMSPVPLDPAARTTRSSG